MAMVCVIGGFVAGMLGAPFLLAILVLPFKILLDLNGHYMAHDREAGAVPAYLRVARKTPPSANVASSPSIDPDSRTIV